MSIKNRQTTKNPTISPMTKFILAKASLSVITLKIVALNKLPKDLKKPVQILELSQMLQKKRFPATRPRGQYMDYAQKKQ